MIEQLQGKQPVPQATFIDESPPNLKILLQESKQSLLKYLLPLVSQHEKCFDKLFAHDRFLLRQMEEGVIEKDEAIRQALETFVEETLKFPTPENIIESIKVDFDYYDVSDELLADQEFMDKLEKFDVTVREYGKGFEKNPDYGNIPSCSHL